MFLFSEPVLCNQDYTEPGTITSPNYPSDYPFGISCGYNISGPSDIIIALTMNDFETETNYDFLSIYDGPGPDNEFLIGRYSGTNIPTYIRSSKERMYVLFTSDSTQSRRGFSADLLFVEPPICNVQFDEPGTFSSPYYPQDYSNNLDCGYNITAPENMIITLEMLDFAIQSDSNVSSTLSPTSEPFNDCPYDYLSAFDAPTIDENQLIGVYCGGTTDIPMFIRSTGRHLYIQFRSDTSITDTGFLISFTFNEPMVCNQTITEPGLISSPYFPQYYPNNIQCDYIINAPPTFQVRLTIHDFELESSAMCLSDSLTLYDSSSYDAEFYIGSFCGVYMSRQIQSTATNLFMRFKTDDTIELRGFNATVEFVGKMLSL